jgi:CspA family cold shock protein
MPDYPNPYDFVLLENAQPVRRAWDARADGIERWKPGRYTGRIYCLLHPETPLYIHDEGQQGQQAPATRQFSRLGGRPGITASALKGAVRSVFEIVSDSCLSSLTEEYVVPRSHQRTYTPPLGDRAFAEQHPVYRPLEKVPQAYLPCTRLDYVCPGCLLFGMVERTHEELDKKTAEELERLRKQPRKKEESGEGTPLAGRVLFGDAAPVQTRRAAVKVPGAGGGPHPWHKAFYFQDDGEGPILGRKLYYHHRNYVETLALYGDGGRAGLIQLDGQLGDFTFQVDFINLTEPELAYLVYSLALEDRIRHHLGYGKPYGLGSARITVSQLEVWQQPGVAGTDRFLCWDATAGQTVDVGAWRDKGRELWLARPNARPAHDAFARILAWPGVSLYKYPDFNWFRRTEGSSNVTLAEYQQGTRTKAAATRPPRPSHATPRGRPAAGRLRGRVESFDKGWGFIRAETGERVFVRFSEIQGTGYRTLNVGDEVEFELRIEDRGPRAYDVALLLQGGRR